MAKKRKDEKAPAAPPGSLVSISKLDQVKDLFHQDLNKILKAPQTLLAFQELERFAAEDHDVEQYAPVIGEIFATILERPIEEQKPLVWAMAEAYGTDKPSYTHEGAGRPTTGRNELAQVVYHRFPDLHVKDKGKDTRAAKRVSDHVARWKRQQTRASTTSSETNEETPAVEQEIPERVIKKAFLWMWAIASNDERWLLIGIYNRRGVHGKTLQKWVGDAWFELTPPNIRDITPIISKEAKN